MLKHTGHYRNRRYGLAAAFRRLCVETAQIVYAYRVVKPAAFRRLCVETVQYDETTPHLQASRLQAAVC